MSWWQILSVALGAVLLVLMVVGAVRANRMRKQNTDRLVAERGWSRRESDPGLAARFHNAPFGGGRDPEAHNVISGTHGGLSFVAFDYKDFRPFQETRVPQLVAVHVVRLPSTGGPSGSVHVDTSEPSEPVLATLAPDLRRRLLAEPGVSYRVDGGEAVSWERGPLDAFALDPDRTVRRLDLLLDLGRSVTR